MHLNTSLVIESKDRVTGKRSGSTNLAVLEVKHDDACLDVVLTTPGDAARLVTAALDAFMATLLVNAERDPQAWKHLSAATVTDLRMILAEHPVLQPGWTVPTD